MTPAILMLYGQYGQHPWQEDVFFRPDIIQTDLGKLGFGFDIAVVTHAPTRQDELPEVRIAKNPVYNKDGILLKADFRPGTISDYPTIIDHWVQNFQDEILQADGTLQRTAHGIGLLPERLWNHKNIQTFGNRKDLMDEIINRHGVGIETYNVLDYEKFADLHGGDRSLIYKPQGGSQGRGIEVFASVKELHEAIQTKRIAANGLIQPYLNVRNPIRGIKPATLEDAVLLERYNSTADRPREIRMHVITTTNDKGELETEAYPMMKISGPNRQFLKYQLGIGIDPASLGPGSFVHDKSIELAQAVCYAAGEKGRPIPQYYGVFDWLVNGDVHNPADIRVGDGNCRGPGLPLCAAAARDALWRALVSSGKRNILAQ